MDLRSALKSGIGLVGVLLAQFSQATPLKPREYSFSQLESWLAVAGNRERNVEDVLEQFPESLRTHYTLMHTSQSLQPGSLSRPRAILFGETAEFVAAFSGHPNANQYNLEFIQYDRNKRSYELRFLSQVKGIDGIARLKLSPPNPKVCTECHRDDPRPNWENYPNWPGAVGEHDDYLFEYTGDNYRGLSASEMKELISFAKSAEQLPMYRKLTPYTVEVKELEPYNYVKKALKDLDPDQLSNLLHARTEANRQLNHLFSQQNYARIVRKITEDADFFRTAGRAIMASFKFCQPFDQFVPRTAFTSPLTFSKNFEEMTKSMSGKDQFRLDDLKLASRLRTVFEAYGKNIDDFSLSLSRSGYRFTSRLTSGRDEIMSDLLRHSPELGEHYSCDELAHAL